MMTTSRRGIIKGLSAIAAMAVIPSRVATACGTGSTANNPQSYDSGPIYYYHPMESGFATTLEAYGAKKACLAYQSVLDTDKDGQFDGVTSAFKSRIESCPSDYDGVFALDWEHAFGVSGGFLKALAGQYGASKQQACIAEAIKVVRAAKALRPNAKFGFYNCPFNGWSYSTLSNPPAWWWAQEQTLAPLVAECDAFFPTIYQYYEIGQQISATEDAKRMRNFANLSLRAAKGKPIYPFVWEVYHPAGGNSGVIPPQQIYWHVSPFAQTEVNGANIAGLYWWGGGSGPDGTEPSLKAFRQALDGTPFQA